MRQTLEIAYVKKKVRNVISSNINFTVYIKILSTDFYQSQQKHC